MESEHVHEWMYVSAPGPRLAGKFLAEPGKLLSRFCARCDAVQALTPDGKTVEELEQQLAQARALLERFAADEAEPLVSRTNDEKQECCFCTLCDTSILEVYMMTNLAIFPHAPECPWLQARAFLAREEAER